MKDTKEIESNLKKLQKENENLRLRLSEAEDMLKALNDSGQDISERRKAEEALVESEMRARHLIKYAPTAIYEIDFCSKKLVTVNEAMVHLSGYSREELLSMEVSKILDDESNRAFQSRIEKLTKGEKQDNQIEYKVKAKDGHIIYALLNVKFNLDEHGIPIGALVVGHDITERKKMEEAFQESEERYKAIIDTQSEFVARYKSGGIIIFVNNSLCRFFNCEPEDFIGRSFLEYIHEDERERVEQGVTSLNKENPTYIAEARVILPDGRVTIQNWTHRALFDANGNIVGYQCNGRDITERKEAEETLKQSEEKYRRIKNKIGSIPSLGNH